MPRKDILCCRIVSPTEISNKSAAVEKFENLILFVNSGNEGMGNRLNVSESIGNSTHQHRGFYSFGIHKDELSEA